MSWAVGYDDDWKRWIGYGVPAYCDHPECSEEIDRGLSYVCGGEPYGGEIGCGLFFCERHRGYRSLCERCEDSLAPFEPKPDHVDWINHMLAHESWATWRQKNPADVNRMRRVVQQMRIV